MKESWLGSEDDDVVGALVAAGRADGPDRAARYRILKNVAAASAVAAGAGAGVAALGSLEGSRSIGLLVAKWLVIGGTAGAVVVGAGLAIVERVSSSAPAPVVTSATNGARAVQRSRGPAHAAMPTPAEAVADKAATGALPPVDTAPANVPAPMPANGAGGAPAVAVATPQTTANGVLLAPSSVANLDAPRADRLAAEVAALDSAGAAIRGGDPRRALGMLDRYAAEYPRGALTQEASLVRIQALVAVGDRSNAERLAQGFATAHPGTPLARRALALVGRSIP